MPPLATAPPIELPIDDLILAWSPRLDLYAEVCLVIRDKQAQMVPLKFNRAQRIVHTKISHQLEETGRIRALVLKARQEGISTYAAARNYRTAHLWANRRGMVIADEKDRGSELFGIYERFQENVPPEVRPRKRWSAKGQHLRLGSGSEITVETAGDVQAGRSLTIHRLHASEVAFWKRADDTFLSLAQAVPDLGSEILVESTANGVGNFFHRMWTAAEEGENGYIAIFLPWFIHEEYERSLTSGESEELLGTLDGWERQAYLEGIPYEGHIWRLSLEQLSWRRITIAEKCAGDERKFRQEYPSTAEEAFLVSGNPFFDEESLKRYRAAARPPLARGNLLDSGGGFAFSAAERGALAIWAFPESEQKCFACHAAEPELSKCGRCHSSGKLPARYVIFGDTAEGRKVAARATDFSDPEGERGGRDFNCADVLEVESRRFVAQLHGRMAPEVFAVELRRLGFFYSSGGPRGKRRPSLIGVERNHSSGQTVLHILREELRYPHLFWHRMVNKRTEKPTDVLGWVTNAETRPLMLDELARTLRDDAISYPNPSGVREMWTFVRGDDGKPEAQEGCHDDRVIAAAGALQMASYAGAEPAGETKEPEVSDTPTGW